jgi:carbamoyltransferase
MNKKAIVGVQIGITSGCAVYRNGIIEFAASEERYSRIKNDTSFPDQAINDAIKACGLNSSDIEKIILVSTRMSPDHFLVNRECKFNIDDYLREQNEYYKPRLFNKANIDFLEVFSEKIDARYLDLLQEIRSSNEPRWMIWNRWRTERVSRLFGVPQDKVEIVNHESAHGAYAYYGSPFRGDDVLTVTFDGFGDEGNASIATNIQDHLNIVHRYTNFNVGRIYRYVTLLLGMKPNEHEYKVMGLAPYASEYTYKKALNVFFNAYKFGIDGNIKIDSELKDHYFYFKDRLEGCRFDGVAAALQIFTEKMTCDLVSHWAEKLGKKRVVLSGGVSLNIKANMEIGRLDCVKDLFVVGSGGDESLCIGGIYVYLDKNNRGHEILPLESLYLGSSISQKEIGPVVDKLSRQMDVQVIENVTSDQVARMIADGKIIGRVAGRMEFGARALGNRSILADPRNSETINKINRKIKNRDFWMPFTPSIMSESANKYLHNPKGFQFPYMSIACETTNEGRKSLLAALHPADKTARPQIVDKNLNPSYHELISSFMSISGVGVLLNTSLNLHGMPIVRTADDASHVLVNSDLDALVIEKTLITRKA